MTKISQAYDGLKARINAVLPDHKQLSNPYSLDQNSEHLLKEGYGIGLAEAVNSQRAVGCIMSISRSINISLTRKFYAAEMNRDSKASAEKQLLEDQYLILKDIENDPDLGLSGVVARFVFNGDNGIQFVFAEDKPFVSLVSNFTLEYFEDLT